MTTKTQAITVEVSKVIKAPVAKLYKAWTDAEQMSKWLGGDAAQGSHIHQDLRVGGEYRIEPINCEQSQCGLISGLYQEIVPNKKLVFTWTNSSKEFPAKDTIVSVEFIEQGENTEIIIKHTKFVAQDVADRHHFGWTASLDKLARLSA